MPYLHIYHLYNNSSEVSKITRDERTRRQKCTNLHFNLILEITFNNFGYVERMACPMLNLDKFSYNEKRNRSCKRKKTNSVTTRFQ